MPLELKADLVTVLEISFDEVIFRGDSIEIDFQLTGENGSPISLNGTTWVFGMQLERGATEVDIVKDTGHGNFQVVIDAQNGDRAELRVTPSNTVGLLTGKRYAFDVQVELATSLTKRLPVAVGTVVFREPVSEFERPPDQGSSNVVSGTSIITGTSREVVVIFAAQGEPNMSSTGYGPVFGLDEGVGDPDPPAWIRVKPGGTKTVAGFTIQVAASPGSGKSYAINWNFERP